MKTATDSRWTGIRWTRWLAPLVGLAALAMAVSTPVDAGGQALRISEMMTRTDPNVVSPSGNSVMADCEGAAEVKPAGWTNATAKLRIVQVGDTSQVVITVRHARPDNYYTVWLRLAGKDSNGDAFGGNPVSGGNATPLAASSYLDDLLEATGPGNGRDDLVNGFHTNRSGHATFRTTLDFPIVAGAYPFERFPDWDPTDPRLPAENPAIYPVAIAGPQGSFTLRVISHCTDQVGHGLASGAREPWFDWTVQGS